MTHTVIFFSSNEIRGLQTAPFATVAHVWFIQEVTSIPFYNETKKWHEFDFNLHAIESELAYSQVVINAQVPLLVSAIEGVKTQIPSNPPELHAILVLYV